MRVLLFGGTTEGRRLAERLTDMGAQVTVSVATEYGREVLRGQEGLAVLTGRKTAGEMAALLRGADICIDATHPYAVEATKNIQTACKQTGVPYRRCLRERSHPDGWICARDAREAAELTEKIPGNILLTTGAKELPAFAGIDTERLYARILPSHEGLAACERLGLPKSHIIAMQGPFSQRLNEALMEQLRIAVLVTKDGGPAGGFPEKCAAAKACGAALIVIGRPPEAGAYLEEIVQEIKEWMA